ncbi:MAG: nucleotidyltransferase domain-containing protein [Sulfolobales archaeon]
MFWARYHINYLRMWREAVKKIAEAARDIEPSAEVYVFGGAAEDRLTVLSDIDVAIVLEKPPAPEKLVEIRRKIYSRAVDIYGLPWDYPVEIHVMGREEFMQIERRGKTLRIK